VVVLARDLIAFFQNVVSGRKHYLTSGKLKSPERAGTPIPPDGDELQMHGLILLVNPAPSHLKYFIVNVSALARFVYCPFVAATIARTGLEPPIH
jgi:hypothetical protein